ncbi:MAG: ATP-binding protein [Bacteroidaceae bacterium]|nr:ATP-binding protein [Bacteroidaceae bacterium]
MATTRKMDLLTAVEQIVEKAKDSKLSPEFYRKASRYIKYVSDKLDLTKEQSVMLALFINRSDDDNIRISDLGEFVKCQTVHMLQYLKDIDVLVKRELLRCHKGTGSDKKFISYRVQIELIDAIKLDEKYVPRTRKGLSCHELFAELEDIFQLREDHELSFEMTTQMIHSLFEDNHHLNFVQTIQKKDLDERDEMLLVLFCHLFANNGDDNIYFYDLDFLFEKSDWRRVKSDLRWGCHRLFNLKMIENANDSGMASREKFRMTDTAKTELLSELDLDLRYSKIAAKDMIRFDKIVEKKLFYGEIVQSQITELSQLLENSHYHVIHTRMQESGLRCGFTCLFYGAPGTGKTETVLQLAHQTGRDIYQVNVSQIKSCWVGDSEKNIKRIFDTYRELARKSTTTPILLFNEADAIINKRMEGAESAVNKMENTIQNIILQEMETLDGILIATTNLAQNMDKAFERRFLYKIQFEKPTLEARMHIWHEMIPTLSEDDTKIIAEKYDFCGGQIENVARRNTINGILYGDKGNSLETLMSYCDKERFETKATRKIGF